MKPLTACPTALLIALGFSLSLNLYAQELLPPQTNRLIVKYRASAAAFHKPSYQAMAPLHAIANRAGLQLRFLRTTHNQAHVVTLDRFADAQTLRVVAASMKAAMPDEIDYVEPDHIAQPGLTPNDPRYLDQWYLYSSVAGIRAPNAWDLSTGGGVRIAVIDSGYRPHPDLSANSSERSR